MDEYISPKIVTKNKIWTFLNSVNGLRTVVEIIYEIIRKFFKKIFDLLFFWSNVNDIFVGSVIIQTLIKYTKDNWNLSDDLLVCGDIIRAFFSGLLLDPLKWSFDIIFARRFRSNKRINIPISSNPESTNIDLFITIQNPP